jgi:hypothetical protein
MIVRLSGCHSSGDWLSSSAVSAFAIIVCRLHSVLCNLLVEWCHS